MKICVYGMGAVGGLLGWHLARSGRDVSAVAREVGKAVGCAITQSGKERLAVSRELGAFRTSMLQDRDAGKPLEIEALLGAVHEIAGLKGILVPNLSALLGLARLMEKTRQA